MECGVKNDLSNLEEVAAEMLQRFEKETHGEYRKEDLHLFITLMEAARQKKELERKSEAIRRSH